MENNREPRVPTTCDSPITDSTHCFWVYVMYSIYGNYTDMVSMASIVLFNYTIVYARNLLRVACLGERERPPPPTDTVIRFCRVFDPHRRFNYRFVLKFNLLIT